MLIANIRRSEYLFRNTGQKCDSLCVSFSCCECSSSAFFVWIHVISFSKSHRWGIWRFPTLSTCYSVSDNAKPRVVKPVPVAHRQAVEKENVHMVQQGILQKAEKAKRVHQIHVVTVLKPNGEERITTNLSPLNKYVIPERYMFQTLKNFS